LKRCEEVVMIRSFLQSLLACITLGMVSLGCSKSEDAPATSLDVTLHVPGMY
jgi:hypothetical protein